MQTQEGPAPSRTGKYPSCGLTGERAVCLQGPPGQETGMCQDLLRIVGGEVGILTLLDPSFFMRRVCVYVHNMCLMHLQVPEETKEGCHPWRWCHQQL